MLFDIITVLPEFFTGPLRQGVLGRAQMTERLQVRIHHLRDYSEDRHRKVDDVPYGGGGGMVIKPEPVFRAVEAIQVAYPIESSRTILLSPQGRRLDQTRIGELARYHRLILICGRYEGVDERIRTGCVDEEISVGDYVLSGGEPAALILLDAVGRLQPGVLGNKASAEKDSFRAGILDSPRYTRPEIYRGMRVPEVLRSGNHEKIESWRREKAFENTQRKRPDLLKEKEFRPGRKMAGGFPRGPIFDGRE